ncbi:hypothetical protein CKAH01_17576 [Colletotrichum kahawae]|uniref:Ankyrin n=1 Tax=Colletotrichum kahawae TaxID=34407 RepID=A0AAE0D693_COLKA|nr:hypothetical protein CKAH01_17576 [Colletotrichum kahawae]
MVLIPLSAAIHVATYYGHIETCEKLVSERYAPLNAYDIGQYLLENGAKTPPWGLYAVTYHRNDDIAQEPAKLALEAGADSSWVVCIPSSTCSVSICYQFREALKYGTTVLTQQLLLDAQKDDLWNDPNMSILEAAIITCHEQTVEKIFALNPARFVNDGLPFWHQYDLQSVSPTVFALQSRESLSLMLKYGYEPDRFTMRAATDGFDRDVLKTLLESPRLPNFPDNILGPLSYAVTDEKYDVVRFLLENGEDVNQDNHHVHDEYGESARNPLQSAVENKDLYLIDLLLKSGADANTPAARHNGATALQLAAIAESLGILRTLIDHGADINAPGAQSGVAQHWTDGEMENASKMDGSDHLGTKEGIYDPTEGMEPPDDLEDLEMGTKDLMAFMTWEL